MYSKKTSLLIGFHGCDESTRNDVINGGSLNPSLNSYDWLGNGIYFWEADPQRALEWAKQAAKRESSSVKVPAVLGAVIDLGNCLDLMNRQSIPILKSGYEWLKKSYEKSGESMPANRNIKMVLCQDLKQIKMRIFHRKINICSLSCIYAII